MNITNDITAKRIAKTIVELNRIFSNPLLVCFTESPVSEPPKAPPSPSADVCIKIAIISSTDKTIWVINRIVVMWRSRNIAWLI